MVGPQTVSEGPSVKTVGRAPIRWLRKFNTAEARPVEIALDSNEQSRRRSASAGKRLQRGVDQRRDFIQRNLLTVGFERSVVGAMLRDRDRWFVP
jgi:hypothetical protein